MLFLGEKTMFVNWFLSRPPRGADYPVVPAASLEHQFRAGSIGDLYVHHEGFPSTKWVHYFEIYDLYLSRLRDLCTLRQRAARIIEVGVGDGGSLQVWKKFFGSESQVVGIDVDPESRKSFESGVEFVLGSQSDEEVLRESLRVLGNVVDLVIDDGSHRGKDQIMTFEHLWPFLSVGGVYIVEDLHTAYWRQFGGGVRRRGTFVEYAKDLVDDIHRWYHRAPRKTLRNVADQDVSYVSFHDSVVVIVKGSEQWPQRVDLGNLTPET